MIRNIWAVFCRDIITDQETNSVTYVRCIEEGAAARLPANIGPLFLGTLWEKSGAEPETAMFRVVLVTPNQKRQPLLQSRPVVIDRPRHRLQFRFNALNLDEFGTYTILVEFNQDDRWETAARLPVLIRPAE